MMSTCVSVSLFVEVATLAAEGIRVLISRIDEEIKQTSRFKDDLEEFKEQLTNISWLLAGASSASDSSTSGESSSSSSVPTPNPMMANWLKKIKEVSDNAEDLLDELSYETLKVRFQTRKRDKLKAGFTHPLMLRNLSHKVKDLKELIQSIYDDAKKLGIEPIKVAAGDAYAIKPSRLVENKQRMLQIQRQCVDQELMIGRDEDVAHLVRLVCDPANNNKDLTIIGIVGFPGIGKTTLIKRVSNVEEVLDCFNSLVIWLALAHNNFDLIESLNNMVEILFREASNMKDKQALILKLQEKLRKEKYLLILDDVWDTTFLEPFRLTLQEIGGSKGSTLLVTSRCMNVVARMETYRYGNGEIKININQTITLQGLTEANSWSLFMARVSDDNLSNNREKELIARKLIKYCGGVPLAIRALGDLLRDKELGRWKEIEKSDFWKKEDEYGFLPSLRLSYNCLPNAALKKCFAYFAIFEENEVIEKDRLIYMWMALGFLQSYGEMELIGEEYFKFLLNSSFFHDVETDEYGNVKTFKIRSLVLSMARVVSMEECLCSNDYNGSSEVVRHLSVPCSEKEFTLACCTKLQTCLHKGLVRNLDFLLKCMDLRVLSIGRVWDKNLRFDMVSSLKHLRYLELNVNDELENLKGKRRPPNIKPYHLQTLWIRFALSFDDHSIPKSCAPFFRNGISDLVHLRHIHYPGLFGIPEGLGHLTALQTLPIIDLKKNWGGSVSELGSLTSLRGTLEIRNLNCVNVDEMEEDPTTIFSVDKLEFIDKVILDWDNMLSGEQSCQNGVFEALKPNSNVKVFKVCGYLGTKFPGWLMERTSPLQNLVSLSFKFCLYGLGDLKMDNFRYLRFLSIQFCWNLSISFPYNGFQCCKFLEELKVINCNRVVNLPDLSPLTHLRCLHFKTKNNTTACQLVGLGSLSCLKELETNQLLPTNLDEHSPLCKSLQILTLGYDDAKTIPIQLQHLVELKFLKLHYYHNVETIPDWLGNLTHLRDLLFQTMPKLKCLPSEDAMQRLSNLNTLQLNQCLSLRNDFRNKTGEWFKVAHILNISLDRQPIVKTPIRS